MKLILYCALVALTCGCGADPVAELLVQLQDPDAEVRRTAARRLGVLGPEAVAAVDGLQSVLDDQDGEVRRLAAFALGAIGPEAASAKSALSEMLVDSELSVRLAAAFALQKIDPQTRDYVPVLVETMRTGEGGVIVAVGQLQPPATWAIPVLAELLVTDERAGIRRLAAEALGRIGAAEETAHTALQKALRDQDDRVRETARAALDRVNATVQDTE